MDDAAWERFEARRTGIEEAAELLRIRKVTAADAVRAAALSPPSPEAAASSVPFPSASSVPAGSPRRRELGPRRSGIPGPSTWILSVFYPNCRLCPRTRWKPRSWTPGTKAMRPGKPARPPGWGVPRTSASPRASTIGPLRASPRSPGRSSRRSGPPPAGPSGPDPGPPALGRGASDGAAGLKGRVSRGGTGFGKISRAIDTHPSDVQY